MGHFWVTIWGIPGFIGHFSSSDVYVCGSHAITMLHVIKL